MKRISRNEKILIAVAVNLILIAALIAVFLKAAGSPIAVLVVALLHISVCGSLLYFLYLSPAETKREVAKTTNVVSSRAVQAAK